MSQLTPATRNALVKDLRAHAEVLRNYIGRWARPTRRWDSSGRLVATPYAELPEHDPRQWEEIAHSLDRQSRQFAALAQLCRANAAIAERERNR